MNIGYDRDVRQLSERRCMLINVDFNLSELMFGKNETAIDGIKNIAFIQATGNRLPFRPSFFDGAILLGLLGAITGENAKQIRELIVADAVGCLKPGGQIYIAEFARITDPEKRDFYGDRWIEVYQRERRITGEEGSFTVRRPDGSTHFLAHHFRQDELSDLLARNGIEIAANLEVLTRSMLSGNISPIINIWGIKSS